MSGFNKNNGLNFLQIICIGLIVYMFTYSCTTTYDTIGNRNFADKYNPNKVDLHPEYMIYMKAENEYRLYFRFFPAEFAFGIIDEDSVPKTNIKLFYRVTKDYQSIEILDSLSQIFKLKGKPRPQFQGYVPINFPGEGNYALEVFLIDRLSKKMVSHVFDINVNQASSEHSSMLLSKLGTPAFRQYFTVDDSIRIRNELSVSNNLKVAFYNQDTTLPVFPDIPKEIYLDPIPHDSSWIIENIDTSILTFAKTGVYVFSDEKRKGNKTLLCVDDYFPYERTPEKLLSALRYLCTPQEMKKLWAMESPKIALDTFWLSAVNDVDRARELIRVYYNRVQLANYYFTNYKEGWLTDRGMIYIICGAPALIQKDINGEQWVYGKGATDEMKFYFYKDKHPNFGDTFILDRSDLYTRIWFNAISAWRDGRIFSLNL